MNNEILIVGSVALDSVETPSGQIDNALGGAATYSSMAASFFKKPRLVGVVGEDFPEEYYEFLKKQNIDLRGLNIIKGEKTFRWKGYYGKNLNEAKTLETHLNVFEKFKPEIPEEYKDSGYVFLANIHPELQYDVLKQVTKPKLVLCDTMNLWIQMTKDALLRTIKEVDILIINDGEARLLAEDPSLMRSVKKILDFGPKKLIVKKGEHGVMFVSKDSIFLAPAYPVEDVFDPTGAGDTFAGGLIGYLAETDDISDKNIRKGLIYGTATASYNIEKFSLERLKEITKKDLDERYEYFKSITKFW